MLEDLLNNESTKETDIQKYLEKNSNIMIAEFGQTDWYYNILIPQFKFGSDYIADFVFLKGQSFSFWIDLIEIKPACSHMFNKDGTFSQKLNKAVFQVNSWKYWINENESAFREHLQKELRKKYSDFAEDFRMGYTRRFVVKRNIIMSRRNLCVGFEKQRQQLEESGIHTITYDRLIQAEKNAIEMTETKTIRTPYWEK